MEPQKSSDPVLFGLEGGVATITLNRPDFGNALLHPMRAAIVDRLVAWESDPDVRVIVLTSAGERHFCTGADVGTLARQTAGPGPSDKRPGDAARFISKGHGCAQELITALLDCTKPIVAAVQGAAAGMGFQMVLCCDIVVAADHARFIEAFILRGIMPDAGAAYLLPRRIGLQKAKELLYFGDTLPAADAERLGIVNKVVPQAELALAVKGYTDRFVNAPTLAIGFVKQLLHRSLDVDRTTSLAEEALAADANSRSADTMEGIRAFIEKREANFRGR